jgi:hypothetical protein
MGAKKVHIRACGDVCRKEDLGPDWKLERLPICNRPHHELPHREYDGTTARVKAEWGARVAVQP